MQAPTFRSAGTCVLLASAFLGVNALGPFDDPGFATRGGFDHFHEVLALQPDLILELPLLVVLGEVAEAPAATVVDTLPRLVPSRGPPA